MNGFTASSSTSAAEWAEQGWPAPMGLDDERIDDPGYRPRTRWRTATGTGVASVGPRSGLARPAGTTPRTPEQGQGLEAAS